MTVERILFVCTGNICRSPTAEGVARGLAGRLGCGARFEFDSAATHGYHVGEPPDPRSVAAAARRGYDLAALRARRVTEFDFTRFDRVLAMGRDHLTWLRRACPTAQRDKVGLFLDFSEEFAGGEVPDPYYGDAADFERVLDLVEHAAECMLRKLAQAR